MKYSNISFKQLQSKEVNNLKKLLRVDFCQKQSFLENVKFSINLIMWIGIVYKYLVLGDGE